MSRKKADFNYNEEEFVEFETDSGIHYISLSTILNRDEKGKYPRWKGRGLFIDDLWFPIEMLGTDVLIKYMRNLQDIKNPMPRTKRKIKFLAWVIKWRNFDPSELPHEFRYIPQQWKLNDINEYNMPPGLLELSLLYRLALKLGNKGQILMLHRELKKRGYIYRPASTEDDEYLPERLEIKSSVFTDDEKKVLSRRNLDDLI